MSFQSVDGNLANYTDQIMDLWSASRAEKKYFPDSALSGKIDKDTLEVSNNKNTSGEKTGTAKDGADDGKISLKEKVANFGKGLIAPIKTMVSSPKNIAITAASIAAGAGIIALTGGAAAPVFVAAGLIGGGVQIGKGIYNQSKAKTDDEAAKAWQQMGSGTFTVGVSAAGAKTALKTAGIEGAKDMNALTASAKCLTSAPKQISASIGKLSSLAAKGGVSSGAAASAEGTTAPKGAKTPEPTVAAEGTAAPKSAKTPEPTVVAEGTTAPKSAKTPEPTVAAEGTAAPKGAKTPEPTVAAEGTTVPKGAKTPEPTVAAEGTTVPKGAKTPEPTVAAEGTTAPKGAKTPEPTVAAERTTAPKGAKTPEPTVTAEGTAAPKGAKTPEPTVAAEGTAAPKGARTPEPTVTAEGTTAPKEPVTIEPSSHEPTFEELLNDSFQEKQSMFGKINQFFKNLIKPFGL